MIELRHLRTLAALAEAGSVTEAARRVFLTQSALSHQIRALEAHCRAPLFVRNSQPLRLTAVGERLLAARRVGEELRAAEREVAKLAGGEVGSLRIAVECHTCFDWLMPAMDAFREQRPDVEMDLVSGFHPDPVGLLVEGRADLVVVGEPAARPGVTSHPLFRFEIVGLVANRHPLAGRGHLEPADFAAETLITYPVPEARVDVLRRVLAPAGVAPVRRTAELTAAILQLVASRRGVAALPAWAVDAYLARGYVTARPIGAGGLWGELHAATPAPLASVAYLREFLATVREVSFATLRGLRPLD